MTYKKRTSLLSAKIGTDSSNYAKHHSSWSSSFTCVHNKNAFMKGKQQGSLYWHPSCFGQGRSRKFNDLVWLPPQSVSSSTSIMVSSSSPPPFPILTSPSPLDWESEKQIKLEIDRLQQEIGIQKSSNLKKEIDAYETKNYRLKREHHNSMALSLLCEERIDAIETELSEMEVKRSIKDTQGMVVDDTHCKKCCERRIEYAVASCFRFAYCEVCAMASDFNECVVCGESITHSQEMYMG